MLLDAAELPRALARDYREADLAPADRAMLDYAVKLTVEPHAVRASDVQALRDHGFSDAAILDVCQVTCYYNYVNRLADGLAVELEPFWSDAELVLTRAEFEERRAADAEGPR
jgi:uncharacterized peroxidase-related enzyme